MILSNWKNEGQKRKDRKRYMIYTITFNSALDYTTQVENFEIGKINRTKTENILAGGKGLNVSIILKGLGIDNIAFSFIAGFTGKEIENRLIHDFSLDTYFIDVKNGYSRINFKMKSDEESEVNGNGPEIREEHLNLLREKLSSLQKGDILILSGSIPPTCTFP